MRLRYTLPAIADLASILDYVADRSPVVIARSEAAKQSMAFVPEPWIASRSLSSGGALRRPVGSQ